MNLWETLVVKPNKKYDSIEEPWRFLLFIGVFSGFLFPLTLPDNIYLKLVFMWICIIAIAWRILYQGTR